MNARVKPAARIFTGAIWTAGDQVDVGATLQGSGAYVLARPRQHNSGVVLQVLGKHSQVDQERSVTVTLSRDEALQLASEILDASEDAEEAMARSQGGRHGA